MIGEPLFLTLDEALQIHADMIATYGGSGTAAAITFLKMNGVGFCAEQMEVAELAERVADGGASKRTRSASSAPFR